MWYPFCSTFSFPIWESTGTHNKLFERFPVTIQFVCQPIRLHHTLPFILQLLFTSICPSFIFVRWPRNLVKRALLKPNETVVKQRNKARNNHVNIYTSTLKSEHLKQILSQHVQVYRDFGIIYTQVTSYFLTGTTQIQSI